MVGLVGPKPAARFPWEPRCTGSSSSVGSEQDDEEERDEDAAAVAAFTCGDPGVPIHGSVSGNGFWGCGDVAVWHCDPGTVLTGATFAYCLHNGWTSPTPKCVPEPTPTCLATSGGTSRLTSGTAFASLQSPGKEFFIDQQSDGEKSASCCAVLS